jgi:tetratricopeptide (TPR) repeat protein
MIVEEGCEEARPLVSWGLVWLMFTSNRVPEAGPLLITADEMAALPDPFLAGNWSFVLGFFQYWWGRSDEALRVLRRMPEAAAQVLINRLSNWWVQGLALGTKGDYEAALTILKEALATSERVGGPLFRPRILNSVGWIYGELEDHERAMEWNRSSVEMVSVSPASTISDVQMHARLNLGDNLMALGRPDEAEKQFRVVEGAARSTRPADLYLAWRYSQHLFHSYGELCLRRRDLERAMAYADECLELAEYNSSAKNIVKARRLRGEVFIAQGRLGEAEEELAAALQVAHEVGNPPQLWKTHAAIGDLRRAQGRVDDARDAYAQALSIIEEVARSLTDEQLRETFLNSSHVQAIRQAAKSSS